MNNIKRQMDVRRRCIVVFVFILYIFFLVTLGFLAGIRDKTSPVIKRSTAIINYGDSLKATDIEASDDETKQSDITVIANSLDNQKIGKQTVFISASDLNGNTTTKKMTIEVVDKNPPVIKVKDNSLVKKLGEHHVKISDTTHFDVKNYFEAIDDGDVDVSDTLSYKGNVDSHKEGTYKITLSAHDQSDNKTTSDMTIEVGDITPPTMKLNKAISIPYEGKLDVRKFMSIKDNHDQIIDVTTSYLDTSIPGTRQVNVTATDLSGNTSSMMVNVKVRMYVYHGVKLSRGTTKDSGMTITKGKGVNNGPSGKETWYNLDMQGVVKIMRRMGNNDPYWVREDGVKMLGDYVMIAANLDTHPRGSLVKTSLGLGIVCDTGDFAKTNPNQIDIAVNW